MTNQLLPEIVSTVIYFGPPAPIRGSSSPLDPVVVVSAAGSNLIRSQYADRASCKQRCFDKLATGITLPPSYFIRF